jgi:hypothetical protein
MNLVAIATLSVGDTFTTISGTTETVEKVRAEWLVTDRSAWSTKGADGDRKVHLH